jgi:hypothetical protein
VLVAETLLVRSEVRSTKRELTNTLQGDHREIRIEKGIPWKQDLLLIQSDLMQVVALMY